MIKKVLLFSVFALLLACTSEAPKFESTISTDSFTNEKLADFVQHTQQVLNDLSNACVSMNKKADAFRNVDFNTLSQAKQYKLVQLDHDYVAMWYKYNVELMAMSSELYNILQKCTLEESTAIGQFMLDVNNFVQKMKDTYGEDLHLDKTSPTYQNVL